MGDKFFVELIFLYEFEVVIVGRDIRLCMCVFSTSISLPYLDLRMILAL